MISRVSSRFLSIGKRFFHDPAQPPTSYWVPPVTEMDRFKMKKLEKKRMQWKEPLIRFDENEWKSTGAISQQTIDALNIVRKEGLREKFYATVEINTKPFSVTKNDIVITKRLPRVQVGDVVKLTNVREIGSKYNYIRGSPLISSKYVNIEALIMENTVSAKYTKYLRRVGKGGGDRKWRKRSYRDNLTVLRITRLEVVDINQRLSS